MHNLALSNGKKHLVEIMNYTRIIEQLVSILQINSQEGDLEYKSNIAGLLNVLTEVDQHCLRVGGLFPQVPELLGRLSTLRLSPD